MDIHKIYLTGGIVSEHNRTERRNVTDLVGTGRYCIEKAESGDQTGVFNGVICKEFDNYRFV